MDTTPLHTLNPLNRFSDRVEDYVKYRPNYPALAIDQILEGLAPPSQLIAADIGAGTGISTRQLAERGVNVIAIEPNAAMRDAGRNAISTDTTSKDATSTDATSTESKYLVEWKDGTAQVTNLPDASVDLITCFQAFHWFDPEPTLLEFRRILKDSGRLAVIWNNRDRNDEFTAEYSRIIRAISKNHPAESRMKTSEALLVTPHFVNFREYTFAHKQDLNLTGLIGRATSSSYIPRKGEAYEQLVSNLQDLFQHFSKEQGYVSINYCTSVHIGQVVKN